MADTVGTIHSRAKIVGSGLTIITGECDPTDETVIVRTGLKHITTVHMDYMEAVAVANDFPWWTHGTGLDGDLVTMTVATGKRISFSITGLE